MDFFPHRQTTTGECPHEEYADGCRCCREEALEGMLSTLDVRWPGARFDFHTDDVMRNGFVTFDVCFDAHRLDTLAYHYGEDSGLVPEHVADVEQAIVDLRDRLAVADRTVADVFGEGDPAAQRLNRALLRILDWEA